MLGVENKQPAEVLDYDVEFEKWLPDGDALSTAAITTDDDTIDIDSYEIIGTVVRVWLSGGDDGTTYKITVTATTNDGRVKEAEFRIRVREL